MVSLVEAILRALADFVETESALLATVKFVFSQPMPNGKGPATRTSVDSGANVTQRSPDQI